MKLILSGLGVALLYQSYNEQFKTNAECIKFSDKNLEKAVSLIDEGIKDL